MMRKATYSYKRRTDRILLFDRLQESRKGALSRHRSWVMSGAIGRAHAAQPPLLRPLKASPLKGWRAANEPELRRHDGLNIGRALLTNMALNWGVAVNITFMNLITAIADPA
jgi:hypothetical protein